MENVELYANLLKIAYTGITRNIAFIRANPDADNTESFNEIIRYANSAQDSAEKIAVMLTKGTDNE